MNIGDFANEVNLLWQRSYVTLATKLCYFGNEHMFILPQKQAKIPFFRCLFINKNHISILTI